MKRLFFLPLALLLAALLFAEPAAAKKKKAKEEDSYKYETVYLFGFSFSFADSTAFLTDIQKLDSAQIGSHGMLMQRGIFSDQMRSHLLDKGIQLPTCIIFFSKSPKKANKQLRKVMKRYDKEKVYWRIVPPGDFTFSNPISNQ